MSALPFHPLADVFPLMEGREFNDLVADVAAHGLNEPIITHDGMILDGRNRYRACQRAGVPYRLQPFAGEEPAAFVISANLRRRHLNESQRAMVAAKLANMSVGRPPIKSANLQSLRPPSTSRAEAGRLLNVSERAVNQAAAVRERGTPEIVAKVERGELAVSAAEKQIRKVERAKEVELAATTVPPASTRYRLLHGSLTDLMAEPPASVDLICTDPPYPEEYLPLFDSLGTVSAHLLRPGGLLLCMSGQTYLPSVIASLARSLSYHWTIAYLTPGGQATQIFPRKVNTFWKPVLVFSRAGDFHSDWFGDVARSDVNDNDKDHHHWGQSETGMTDLMRRFVKPGMIVADPFLGGGTTGLVSLQLGASFIGCDVDETAINTTKARLAHAGMV